MAHEILEKNKGDKRPLPCGNTERWGASCKKLAGKIKEIEGKEIPVGSLDIAFYRDDLSIRTKQPAVRRTEVPCEITDMKVVLVDDVLFTGRSIRTAMDALMDMGRPLLHTTCGFLMNRGHRGASGKG